MFSFNLSSQIIIQFPSVPRSLGIFGCLDLLQRLLGVTRQVGLVLIRLMLCEIRLSGTDTWVGDLAAAGNVTLLRTGLALRGRGLAAGVGGRHF